MTTVKRSARGKKIEVPGSVGKNTTETGDAFMAEAAGIINVPEIAPAASGRVKEGKGARPRAADIDPQSISKAVLTVDGWVVPETSVQQLPSAAGKKG